MFPCVYISKKKRENQKNSILISKATFMKMNTVNFLGEKNVEYLEFRRDREGILPNKYGSF